MRYNLPSSFSEQIGFHHNISIFHFHIGLFRVPESGLLNFVSKYLITIKMKTFPMKLCNPFLLTTSVPGSLYIPHFKATSDKNKNQSRDTTQDIVYHAV